MLLDVAITGLALLLSAAGAIGLWLILRSVEGRWFRLGVRLLLVPAAGLFAGAWLLGRLDSPKFEGTYLCRICGDREAQLRYAGWIVDRSITARGKDSTGRAMYAAWFDRDVRAPHEHDWVCIQNHASICTWSSVLPTVFSELVELPDRELAVDLARRWAGATDAERNAVEADLSEQVWLFRDGTVRRGGPPFVEICERHIGS